MAIQLTPFILLDGKAKEAIAFYEKALGAQVLFTQTYGEAPDREEHALPSDTKDRLAHSVLKVGGADLFVADSLAPTGNEGADRVQICMTTPDIAASRQYYEALQQGGRVVFPLQKVHFSPAYGIVTDRFGVTFLIFTQRP
ncbi:VOC family protein [Paenibacillus gansuensis]|uniref:VOC family protein n=1 Tax=Paenibacillus gansuensis TaxID=306542 RepID=A0ABW5PKD4_9BACL